MASDDVIFARHAVFESFSEFWMLRTSGDGVGNAPQQREATKARPCPTFQCLCASWLRIHTLRWIPDQSFIRTSKSDFLFLADSRTAENDDQLIRGADTLFCFGPAFGFEWVPSLIPVPPVSGRAEVSGQIHASSGPPEPQQWSPQPQEGRRLITPRRNVSRTQSIRIACMVPTNHLHHWWHWWLIDSACQADCVCAWRSLLIMLTWIYLSYYFLFAL